MSIESSERKLERLGRRLETLMKKVDVLTRIITEGSRREYPWYRLKPARMKAVEAVLNCIREHKSLNIRQAAHHVFVAVPEGYPTWEALATYCYDINLPSYAKESNHVTSD